MRNVITLAVILLIGHAIGQEEQTCSWNDLSCFQDPHLKEIAVDLGKGLNETFLAYFPPDVSTFYRQEPFSRKPVAPTFNGQFGKFINLSPKPITIFWYVPVTELNCEDLLWRTVVEFAF